MQRRLLIACLAGAVLTADAQNRLIKLQVVALDSRDQPVGDLTADDFQIQEQGKNLRIAVFRKNDPKAGTGEPALGPHEFSNRAGSAPPAVTVILFDLLRPIDERFGRSQLAKAAADFQPVDYTYLYLLTARGPLPVRGLPEQRTGEGAPSGPLTKDEIDAAFGTANHINVDSAGLDTIDLTYRSLQGVASRLAGLPGRKSIVWISRGVPVSAGAQTPGAWRDYTPRERQLTATLQRGNIAVYPVSDSRREIGSQSMGTLNDFAGKTGGRPHMDMDVGAAIRQAMQDSRASYTLEFDPRSWDDKYHKVRVSCVRSGVRVLAQDGYYPFAAPSLDDEGIAIEAAQWSPFDAGEIGMRAVVSPSEKIGRGVRLGIRINAGDVQLARNDTGYSGHLAVTLVAYDAVGRQTILRQTGYPFKMTAEQHEDALKHGITLSPEQAVKDDVRRIRIIVFDRNSNTVGSLTVPVTDADRGREQ